MSLREFTAEEIAVLVSLRFKRVSAGEYEDKTLKDSGVVITALKSAEGYILINAGEDNSQETFRSFEEMFSLVEKN